jgi:transcriptional regulator GlxA family with amidase domain
VQEITDTKTDATLTIGIVLFDGAEELDWVGPFEVFTMAREVSGGKGAASGVRVVLVNQEGGLAIGAKGLRNEVDASFADAPKFDVLLIPGGFGTRAEMKNPRMLEFLAKKASECEWVTSVCTGSGVLEAAGLTQGKRITTHWGYLATLREDAGDATTVLENVRYVRDGRLLTAAGVSAGIDMALWLTGELFGVAHARLTQKAMEYDPAPPYAAEV